MPESSASMLSTGRRPAQKRGAPILDDQPSPIPARHNLNNVKKASQWNY